MLSRPVAVPKPTRRAVIRKRLKPCPVCGGARTNSETKTCSRKCGNELRRKTVTRTCGQCGREHQAHTYPGAIRQKYCSIKCYRVVQNQRPAFITVACFMCGATFKRTLAAVKRGKRSFCSRDCMAKFKVGPNNVAWRGGSDPNRGKRWEKIAQSIRERDGLRCKRCDMTQEANGVRLSVDHIRPWRSFTDENEANHPDNLVSLCKGCHAVKTQKVESAWLRGDVLGWKQWVASLHMPSAARFGFMA
jgi:5-methylcytosine-specific restriction endonuclease McrA